MNIRKVISCIFALVISFSSYANVPVVFLHGWEGGAENWTAMTNLLVQSGGYSAEDLHPIDYWRTVDTSIETYASIVNDQIVGWLASRGDSCYEVDIVAHSMGGLVVRDIIANNRSSGRYGIRRLVTLATPHYGQNQEYGTAAEQMKYGSSYLWGLAKAWEFENKKIGSVLCVSGVYKSSLDDKLVEHWSAALSDCPVRYVNKVHASVNIGPTIYSCDENLVDPVYRLVRNYCLNKSILSQSECGVSLSGRSDRGGALLFQVIDNDKNPVRYGGNWRANFVRAIEPNPSTGFTAHYGDYGWGGAGGKNANKMGICEITSSRGSYRGVPEDYYSLAFYDSESNDAGSATPSFASEPLKVDNDRTTVTYVTPIQNASDFVFLIDSTGSMSSQISSAKASAKSFLSETLSKSPQSRFAVVEYRDFPVAPYGDSGDFVYKVRCQFTSSQASVIAALNAITTGGGNDTEEALYSAIVACAQGGELGGWLNNNRAIIVMTDAGPHDPEPYTGYTRSSVASILNANGVIRKDVAKSSSTGGIGLYAVLSSSSSSLKTLYSGLCGDTGGTAAFASSSSEVGVMMRDLVQASAARVEADWFVNAASGNDGNTGTSWAAAKKSINSLDGLLQSNDVVAVASGVYEPIMLTNDVVATFKNINDKNSVIIDGGGTNRCVSVPSCAFSFRGFVFRNGFAEGFGGGVAGGTYEACTFVDNHVVPRFYDGGVLVAGAGGAAYDAILKECIVSNNTAVGFGGGIHSCIAIDSRIVQNTAIVVTNQMGDIQCGGGGIAYSSAMRSVISGNISEGNGGGAYSASVVNSLFTSNEALHVGGAVDECAVTNCTIVSNVADSGAGVSKSGVFNSIVWGNSTPSNDTSNCTGSSVNYSCTYPAASGIGNVSLPPRFRTETNYLLSADSPCVDTGHTVSGLGEVDLKKELRIYTTLVDMGAYEYCPSPATPTNLSASVGTYFSGISLTWDHSLVASTYTVWRSTSTSLGSAVEIANVTTNVYLDKEVDSGTVYYYWVKATNSSGTSEFSAMASGARACFPPDSLEATDGTQAESISVTWAAIPNAWYRVYRTDSVTNDFVAISGWQTATTFVDNTAEQNRFYYYAVVSAINSNGDGASSLSAVDRGWSRGKNSVRVFPLLPEDDTPYIYCTTLNEAVEHAWDGETIIVADGVYEPFTCTNRSIVIESVNGPRHTIIDGGGTNRCVTLGTTAGHTNTVLSGFTLRNGNASGGAVMIARNYGGGAYCGTLENCYIYGNLANSSQSSSSSSYGGGAYATNLKSCSVSGNRAYDGGGVYYPDCPCEWSVDDCTFIRNRCEDYGSAIYVVKRSGAPVTIKHTLVTDNYARYSYAIYVNANPQNNCRLLNCTIVRNSGWPSNPVGIGGGYASDTIVWNNRTRENYEYNYSGTIITNSCVTNPSFVDEKHNVYLLKKSSPCVGSGTGGGNIGAFGVEPDNGFIVGTETEGYGLILEPGTVVQAGGNASFTAEEIGREFLYWEVTDGENVVTKHTDHILTLENIQSDTIVRAVFKKLEFFVDATNGNDENDGLSWITARKTIGSAINNTLDYDVVTVTNGVYAPITPAAKKITIRSVEGADVTIIDGGRTRQCINCAENNSGVTNTVIVGFTLRNGLSSYYGGGAFGGVLRNCFIVDCEAPRTGGGSMESHLENCVIARNKAGTYGGGMYYGVADHCTICGNAAGASGGGTYYGTIYNSIVSKNVVGGNEANWSGGTFDSCCTYPNRGSNPITGDPMLVDGWNGDARLRVGSPCIVDGVQVCGAYIGEPLEGISISVGVQGTGSVSNNATLVTSGGSATIEAVETVRPFLYWVINGEQVTNQVYTLTNITSDVRAVAVFGSFDWYVDAEYGDDANDGSDWDTAKRTLQAAVAAAVDDETIYVEAGTYEPISTNNKRIRIESMNGAEMTFIDGGGTNRCATLGSTSTHTNSALIGFTLLNGRAPVSGSYAYGGGSYYGTLEYCIISNCVASGYYAYGGGAYYGYLNNCLVAYNCATSSSYRAYGGGAYSSVLRSCTVAKNCAVGSNAAYYGGVYGGWNSAYNTIIWDNEVVSSSANYSNTYATYLNYCCTDGTAPYRQTGTITNDPQFVDADAGDFHLRAGSPCLNTGYNWYVQGEMDLDWDDRIQGAKVDMGCYEGAEYAAPPGQVTGLVAVRGVLTWDAMPDAEGFMVYRSTRRAASSAKYIGMSDTNTYADETAVDGTTYYYWVQAFNTLGMGTRSDGVENTWPLLLEITTSELPDATEMVGYSAQLEATGGVPPYSWSSLGGYTPTRTDSTYSQVGTAQGWYADDDCWTLELPFEFPFYGNKYRTAYVNSNGTITFDGYFNRWSYSIQNFTNHVMIAALWRDIYTSSTAGDIYVSSNSDSVTIRWACQYNSGGMVAASVTLYANGTIRLAYGSGNVNGGFVGVSAGDGERYTSLGNNLALNAAQDIVLRGGGIADGLFISEDGQIIGTPTEAGTNTFIVTVTDAAGDMAERELSMFVAENPNHKPVIDSASPTTNVYVKVGNSATFAVTAHDPEGATLEYTWYLDGDEIDCEDSQFTFTATLDDAGAHTLECVVSDGLWTDMVRQRWSFRVVRDWYVDAAAEEDSGDGSSSASALAYISDAVWYAEDGDTIYVAPGTYDEYIEFYSSSKISVIATGGAQRTFLTGQVEGYGSEWYRGHMVSQSSITGFTMQGCYLYSVTLKNCVLTSDETGAYPSEVYGCRLLDCAVTGNTCDWAPIEQCELIRCTIAGNIVGEYGVVSFSDVYDSIVWGNVTSDGETSNFDTDTWWGYDENDNEVEYASVQFEHSCTWPMSLHGAGSGVITIDPLLVDAVNGDLRLRVGSPCIVGGVQTMGVNLGDAVNGRVISVRIEGHGAVSPMTAILSDGEAAAFEVTDFTRPFLGFSTNGVFATAYETLTWPNVRADGIVIAAFSNFTFHVDAATGDDANDGLSWATAKASIQSAINNAVRGETIYVKAGTYDPIVVGAAMRLRIESVDGKDLTIIDGGGTNQCANLGGNDSFSSTLVGFTLTNGYSGYGGGATGGTLIDCDIVGNTAMYRGGGLNYSTAIRCIIAENTVSPQWQSDGYGGGAYGCSLINCLVSDNVVDDTSYYGYGGGTCQSSLYNCTVVGNVAHGTYSVYGGGVQSGSLYNSIVFGNSIVAEDENAYTYGEETYNLWGRYNSIVGEYPGFADADNGDYHLVADSTCIDAGSNNYVLDDMDLDGNERVQHFTVDIGCYEYELATPEHDADADFAAQMAGTCYGMFVGVGRYTYTSSLTGPTLDATNMQTRCVGKGYWHDTNTVALLDAAATKTAVRARLAALAAKAVSGDTVLYYQSSHGGSYTSGGEYTTDTHICLYDAVYEDYEMAEDLTRFAAGVKVIIVLDTCHSAGMFKGVGGVKQTGISFALRVRDIMSSRKAVKGGKSGITADDIGWIAAANYNQYSWDSPRGGAFTVAMLDGWKTGNADYDGDKRLNFHELWRYAKGIATGYSGEDATDAQCLNENVLLSRFAGMPDSSNNGEATESTPIPVEHVWLDSYPEILASVGGDYEAMANAQSPGTNGGGKVWPDGSAYYMWQDFVAGTNPTNENSVFTAKIEIVNGEPVVKWEPDTPELRATRVYKTLGKKTLMDKDWVDVTDKDQSEYHFFRVTVDLP